MPDLWLHTCQWARILLREYKGKQKLLYLFCISLLSEFQTTDCSFWNVCTPCHTNRLPTWKTHITISLKQMNTYAQLPNIIKQENSNIIWKRGMSDLYPCSNWQVHSLSTHFLDCLVKDLNYGPWLITAHWSSDYISCHVPCLLHCKPYFDLTNKTWFEIQVKQGWGLKDKYVYQNQNHLTSFTVQPPQSPSTKL
jgi:hypothetical protein